MRTSNIKTPYLTIPRKPTPKLPVNRDERMGVPEPVGGVIQGQDATSREMQWARGLERANKSYIFQYEVETTYSLPGQGKKIDFIVDNLYADEIDGEIGHKTESQKAEADQRDILLSEALHKMGLYDIRRVDAEKFTGDKAVDDLIREMYP